MPSPRLSGRVVVRLAQAEVSELNPHYRDDITIAKLIVLYAANGEAVECSPHVLASYHVLGIHPDKVWPAIEARRNALGQLCDLPPKKPAQSVKLWGKKTNGARAVNSRADEATVLRGPRLLPMATASIAALYPNSDAPSSAKTRGFTYEEMLAIVEFSGAPHSVRQGTLSALKARGRWPNEQGAATGIICISLIGMQFHGVCCRSTARWRARRAVKLGFWRELRKANAWSNCPKCGTKREVGKCEKCGYLGRSRTPEGKPNFDEFSRPYMYEVVIDKFRSAQRPKEIRHFDARTYAEYKEAARRGDHSRNVTEMPTRKPAQPTPEPPPPATTAPLKRPAAEHDHRGTERRLPSLTTRQRAELVQRIPIYRGGHAGGVQCRGGGSRWIGPDDPDYRAPMDKRSAILAACKSMCQGDERYGFHALGVSMEKALEAAADAGFKVDPESS